MKKILFFALGLTLSTWMVSACSDDDGGSGGGSNGGSGGGSNGGSGGGSHSDTCPILPGDDACNQCAKSKCCTEFTALSSALSACFDACQGKDCSACKNLSEKDALYACVDTHCQTVCADRK